MRRLSLVEQHRISLARPHLLALARAHASEHRISVRTALREIDAAAELNNAVGDAGEKSPATATPLIPAYRCRGAGGSLLIQFRCPACGKIHSHGLPSPLAEPLQHRVSHCEFDFGKSRGYRLLIVGWKDGDDLPACSADEIDALNAAICENGK